MNATDEANLAQEVRARIIARLNAWATYQAARDDLILSALRVGLTTTDIHHITGMARSTIGRVIKEHREKLARGEFQEGNAAQDHGAGKSRHGF